MEKETAALFPCDTHPSPVNVLRTSSRVPRPLLPELPLPSPLIAANSSSTIVTPLCEA
jgi:hypothetical protein